MVLTISQLQEVDHIMLALGRKFQELIKIDPQFREANLLELSRNSADETIQTMAESPRVILAQNMLKRYVKGKMQLVDDIVAAKMGVLTEPSKKAKFGLGKSAEAVSKNSGESAADSDGPSDVDDTNWPPKLPSIRDVTLRRQVFTHSSAVQMPELLTKAEALAKHNERLEFKGDSVLDYIICGMLFERFPTVDEGVLTVRKAELVCNSTLWEFGMLYGLPARLQSNVPFHDKPDTPPKQRSKVVADLFEAYIGGLALDRGFDVVEAWLKKLYEPLFRQFGHGKAANRLVDEVDRMAKTELYQKIGSKDQVPEYITDDNESPFTVKCVVNGEILGEGTDRNIKRAGLRAAANALKNYKAIERLAARRRAEPRTAPDTSEAAPTPVKQVKKEPVSLENAKSALYSELGGVKERSPLYQINRDAPSVTVQCICCGEILAEGTAESKSQASKVAALQALQNKAALKRLRVSHSE